jgi:hypothetical protein
MNPSSTIDSKSVRSESAELKRFARILLLGFVPPFLVILGLLELIAFRTGETRTPAEAAQDQAHDRNIVWESIRHDNLVRFKVARASLERPAVLIMGHSRMNQFRSKMFQPYSFYNISRIAWPISVNRDVLLNLPPDYAPKVLFFTVDFFMFNPHYGSEYPKALPNLHPSAVEEHIAGLNAVLGELPTSPRLAWSRTAAFYGGPAQGIQAIKTGNGFRWDGSETWLPGMFRMAGRPPDLDDAKWNLGLSDDGNRVSEEKMAEFQEFVSVAQKKGITVIAVQMPMHPALVNRLEKESGNNVLHDFNSKIAQGYFDRLGVIFFDFLRFPGLGEDYRYYVDARHPTEALSAAVLLAMYADPRVKALLPNLDAAALQMKLEQEKSAAQHIILYGNEF